MKQLFPAAIPITEREYEAVMGNVCAANPDFSQTSNQW
jgi:hypothetical protein